MDTLTADGERLLDAAEQLFYDRGFQSVGMDELRTASGLPLKRIYSLFPGKESIAVAMLDRRDDRWQASLARRIGQETAGPDRVLAVFDWLVAWLETEGHRGCAWINASGELGGSSLEVIRAARRHQLRLRAQIDEAARGTDVEVVAGALFLLFEGAIATAGIAGNADAAKDAREFALELLGKHAQAG